MRVTIVQGLEQAYYNLVHMIAEFLPRFVVMVVIILVGLLAAYLLGHILRAVLRLTKLDRVSGADIAIVPIPSRSIYRHADFISGIGAGEFFVARGAAGFGERGNSLAENLELVDSFCNLDFGYFDGAGGTGAGAADGAGGVFDCFWGFDAGAGNCVWTWRAGSGETRAGEISRKFDQGKIQRAAAAVMHWMEKNVYGRAGFWQRTVF
jgi:hypothetical protein